MFGTEIIVFACGTIAVVAVDRLAEIHGFGKFERAAKLIVPIVAIGTAIYFFDFNPIIKWIGL